MNQISEMDYEKGETIDEAKVLVKGGGIEYG